MREFKLVTKQIREESYKCDFCKKETEYRNYFYGDGTSDSIDFCKECSNKIIKMFEILGINTSQYNGEEKDEGE